MNKTLISSLFLLVLFLVSGCQKNHRPPDSSSLEQAQSNLRNYDFLAHSKVMVLGTFHFGDEVLQQDNQESILELAECIMQYEPTKIVVEWEPERSASTNEQYADYLDGTFDISNRPNEVYQLGFRFAEQMDHDQIYLFDNQTEYIGSLEEFSTEDDPFSFQLFSEYAEKNDSGFYDMYEDTLITTFNINENLMRKLDLKSNIAILNSPEHQKINAQRMHMYEVRIGIQENWAGPDWLGRFYQRNIRMMSNVLKMAEEGDRILIIVGDNHKWILDMLFEHTPDFDLVSSWEYLNQCPNSN